MIYSNIHAKYFFYVSYNFIMNSVLSMTCQIATNCLTRTTIWWEWKSFCVSDIWIIISRRMIVFLHAKKFFCMEIETYLPERQWRNFIFQLTNLFMIGREAGILWISTNPFKAISLFRLHLAVIRQGKACCDLSVF